MSADVQNFSHDKSDPKGRLFMEISLTVSFGVIIILSILMLFGS
jgi:hypothetical protein